MSNFNPITVLTDDGVFELREGLNDVPFSSIIDIDDEDFDIGSGGLEKVISSKVVKYDHDFPEYIVIMEKVVIEEGDGGKTLVRVVEDKMPLDLLIHSLVSGYEGLLVQVVQVMNNYMSVMNGLAKAKSLAGSVGKRGVIPINDHVAIMCHVEEVLIPLPTGDFAVVDPEVAEELYDSLMASLSTTYDKLGNLREFLMVKLESLNEKSPLDWDVQMELKFLKEHVKELSSIM